MTFLLLSSVSQFSYSVISSSLRPPGLQQTPWLARPPCPSRTPGAYSNSCPSSRWCHPTTSSSVIPFSSCPQSFPASGSFPMNQLFTSAYDYFKHLKILDKIQTKAFQVEISATEQWRRETARRAHTGWPAPGGAFQLWGRGRSPKTTETAFWIWGPTGTGTSRAEL